MVKLPINDLSKGLEYSFQEMLGFRINEDISIDEVVESNTAITLRVSLKDGNGPAYFIKTSQKENRRKNVNRLSIRELEFYQLVNEIKGQAYLNIPAFVNGYVSDDRNSFFIVLADMSKNYAEHHQMDFSDLQVWKCAVRSLASFHQGFVGNIPQGTGDFLRQTNPSTEQYIEKLKKAVAQFAEQHKDSLAESVLQLIRRSVPDLYQIEIDKKRRVEAGTLATLTHGDAHTRNFLYPPVLEETAIIIDWQFWNIGIGTYDLRHLLGSALSENMKKHQKELVKEYHHSFSENLGQNYSWEDCWLDYKKGVLDNLFMPVWQYAGFGWEMDRWMDTLTAAVENYYHLKCDELDL